MRTLTQPLNMSPGGIPPVIHVSQYDSDFTIVFTLFSTVGDFTIESGTTAVVRGTKSSGTGYSADAAINISAKTVTVTGNQQMTAAAGQNVFEITLLKNNKEISSKNFILLCERAALDADTITDESVLKELNAIIEGAETATQAAEEAEDAADRAEAAAQSLVIDSTPTQGSARAVSSGGVFEALQSAGLQEDAKQALLACFKHVAWIDEQGRQYYNALKEALNIDPSLVYEINFGTDLSNRTFDTGISAFGIDDDFTILASIKVLPIPTPTTSTSHVLINNGTIGNRNILRLSFDEKNGIDYFVTNYAYGDSYQDKYTPGTVYANVEHDVIWAIRNQNRQLKKQLYIDGTIRVNKTDDLAQYASSVFSGNYTIGGYTASSPAPIGAVVNLFRIYDTALSASDINSMLNIDFSN